jgi:paraquat-inducible protein B
MSKKANPTLIGLFIAVGLALAVGSLILFSSGKFFRKQHKFILYLDSSLKGLNPGAAVRMRGVTIGSVREVYINHNQRQDDRSMPVVIQVDEKLAETKTDRQIGFDNKAFIDRAVRAGLRGRLEAESLLTGVRYIELHFRPNAPPPVFHQLKPEYSEIPTEPTEIQELLSNLSHVDLQGISEKLNRVLTRVDDSLAELDVKQLNAGATTLLASADRLIGSPDLANSLAELKQVLADTRILVKRVDDRVDPLVAGITNVLNKTQQNLDDLRRGIQGLTGMVEPDAAFRTGLTAALDQLTDAARAIADLADFLHRNPNALLTGRKPFQPKP